MRSALDQAIRKVYAEGRREARFWSRVNKDGPNGCWEWTGPREPFGYGRVSSLRAHRIAYELLVGPIPVGLTLDHLCRNPPCVNPAHLEPVTMGVNVLRGDTITGRAARQTTCKRGHPFTIVAGRRVCIECRRARDRVLVVCPRCGRRMSQSGLKHHKKLPHPLRFPAKSHPGHAGPPRRSAPAA